MNSLAIDTLEYVRILEGAGFTRQQAEAQATVMRRQTEAQNTALQKTLEKYDESSRKEMATKGDVLDVRLEIEKVRAEVEKIRAEVEKVRAELKLDIEQLRTESRQMKYDLLKWQLGIGLAIILVIAKGFKWIGF